MMKVKLLLGFILFLFTPLCYGFNFETNHWTDFEGTIGKSSIQLSLYRINEGQVKGNYCYKKYDSKIQLSGNISGDKIVITEYINGKANGLFEGKIFTKDYDRFEGTYTNLASGKSVLFKLTLQSIVGGFYDNRYSDFDGTDADVEQFMKLVKTSILNDNKEWMQNMLVIL